MKNSSLARCFSKLFRFSRLLVCLGVVGMVGSTGGVCQETASNANPEVASAGTADASNIAPADAAPGASPADGAAASSTSAAPGDAGAGMAAGALADNAGTSPAATAPPVGGYPMAVATPTLVPQSYAGSRISNCGDALSDALGQTNSGMPCWSDIRTTDHWNTLTLNRSMTVSNNQSVEIPSSGFRGFNYTLASLNGLVYPDQGSHAQAFAGVGAFSGFLKMRKWQLTFEDGGAGADLRVNGNQFEGLNRGAIRASGSAAARWSWQAGATNSYGSDVLRQVAPPDYRRIGQAEAPVTDVVAYGLHSGNVVDEQEDGKMDYQESRRTSFGVAVGHTLRNYEDDGATIQTERVRAEALHSLSENAAVGLLASGSRQTGPAPCSLAGLGAVGLLQWGSRASVTATGTLNGASNNCGKRVQGTGDLAVYLRVAPRTNFFVSGDRDLSGGVVEQAILLNSASAGIHHSFTSGASLRFTGAAVRFNDYRTSLAHTGTFAEADAILPIGRSFLEETTYRHYQVSAFPDNRNLVTFTLWWAPKRTAPEVLTAHR